MLRSTFTTISRWTCGALMATTLLACSGGGGSSGGSSGTAGKLAFFPDKPVDVRVGNQYHLTLSLENSSGVSGLPVSIAVSDTSVATVDESPSKQ